MKAEKPEDATRSALMSRVRQKGTKAELIVAAILREAGVAYRLNVKSLPGSPDFANKSRKWAVFVHGCFWHRHAGCRRTTTPKRNAAFWQDKFAANQARDRRAVSALKSTGFRVAIVWECETSEPQQVRERLSEFLEAT